MQVTMFVSYDVQDWGIALRMRPKPEEASEFPSSVCLSWPEAQRAFVRKVEQDDNDDAEYRKALGEAKDAVLRSASWVEYRHECGKRTVLDDPYVSVFVV